MFGSIVIGVFLLCTDNSFSVSAWEIHAGSKTGSRLLKKAQKVELIETGSGVIARKLEGQQKEDESWLASMSLKFDSCYNTISLAEEGNGNKNGQAPIENRGVVTFRLCSSYNCQRCSGSGIYAIDLAEFVNAYTEVRREREEYVCEVKRENCGCNDAEDADYCAYACWNSAGMQSCNNLKDGENGQAFDAEDYFSCASKCFLFCFITTVQIMIGVSLFDDSYLCIS